jgi:predicted CopG family antitoxin
MARTISVSDDVYEWMNRKKGDRSFSELIRSLMQNGDLRELEGIGFSRNWEDVKDNIGDSSNKNIDRLKEEYV